MIWGDTFCCISEVCIAVPVTGNVVEETPAEDAREI